MPIQPTPGPGARFTDAYDPILLQPRRAAGPLTMAALLLAGAAISSLLFGPILGWLVGLPLATIGSAFAAIDLGHALLTRRAHWPWALAALAANLATLAAWAWLLGRIAAAWD